jgi:ketosteroid isomerase-like protein
MSENLDLVRSIYAAWERGDFGSLDWADPDIEYVVMEGPNPGRWTGVAEVIDGFREFVGAWDALRVSATECRELDAERVLVLTRLSGHGKASGVALDQMGHRGADVLSVRDGKVTRFILYHNRDRALADLGLKE